ncbi:MAG: DegV family protein [Oscillospiraceae bacterium]|nr:DegV family protein [Oscillospiraceae bacterium]
MEGFSIFAILTDSCADLRPDFVAEQQDFFVLPLSYTIGGETYLDSPGAGLDSKTFYARLRGGEVAITSQVNGHAFCEAARSFLSRGLDVLYVAFSSGLSGTYQSSLIAQEELKKEFPDRRFVAVDTLAASAGQAMLAYCAVDLRAQGKTLDETAAWLIENRLHVAHWFTVDDLNFLKRGGRCSPAAAFFGSMLSIKPVLHVDNEGHLIAREKVRGRAHALRGLLAQMEQLRQGPVDQRVFISNAACLDDAQALVQMIHDQIGVPLDKFIISDIGPVIGSHAGPGTLALFFFADHR